VSLVKILTEHPEIKKMRVEGHTDAQGKAKANKKLSQKRAASVVKWLTKYGVSKKRLYSEGWGQERPIATNNTDEGRRENRRVEFHIVEGPGADGGGK
jgi:outer membrane protein OmpA-like peptidoglycan-associated protein